MKKMLIIILLFFILISNLQPKTDFTLLNFFDGEYSAYTNSNSDNGVDLGFCSITKVATDKTIGESMKVSNILVGDAIEKLNLKVLKTEVLDTGVNVIYGHTKKIGESVTIQNKKVNIQIACYDDYFIIGWPLILGSF